MRLSGKIFGRRKKSDPEPLRIGGVGEVPLTPEPDDAELAAQALLESLAGNGAKEEDAAEGREPEQGTAEFYRRLSDRIRQAHDTATLRTMRFVAFCEQELSKGSLPLTGPGSLMLLNVELMKRIDTVERVGGELEKRWRRCVADVTVRLMKLSPAVAADGTDADT